MAENFLLSPSLIFITSVSYPIIFIWIFQLFIKSENYKIEYLI